MSEPTPKRQKHVHPMDAFITRLQDKDRNQEAAIKHLNEQLRNAHGKINQLENEKQKLRDVMGKVVAQGWEQAEEILELREKLGELTGDEAWMEEVRKGREVLEEAKAKRGQLEKGKGREEIEAGHRSWEELSLREQEAVAGLLALKGQTS